MKIASQLFTTPAGIILLGVLLSALGAFWASRQQAQFERDLRKKSDEISVLNKEIANLVTGGDSFTFVYPVVEENSNDLVFHLIHQGEYPIFDTEILISRTSMDISDHVEEIQRLKASDNPKNRARVIQLYRMMENFTIKLKHVGTIPVNTTRDVYRIQSSAAEKNYNIKIFTRNGIVEQRLGKEKLTNEWKITILKKHENDGPVKELKGKIDPFYANSFGKSL